MTIRPEDVLRPGVVIRETRPRDAALERAIALRLHTAMLAVRLGLEIQARCGIAEMSEARAMALAGHRKVAKQRGALRSAAVPAAAKARLQAAFDALLAKAPCSHCEARFDCPAANAAVLQ